MMKIVSSLRLMLIQSVWANNNPCELVSSTNYTLECSTTSLSQMGGEQPDDLWEGVVMHNG
jgi:hypothetical protein